MHGHRRGGAVDKKKMRVDFWTIKRDLIRVYVKLLGPKSMYAHRLVAERDRHGRTYGPSLEYSSQQLASRRETPLVS